MPPKKIGVNGLPKTMKPRASKERPPGWSNARWAADVERRAVETRGRVERDVKLAERSAAAMAAAAATAAAEEQNRQISLSMNMGQPRVFPGSWPIQGTAGSPSTFSPSSPAFYHENYTQSAPLANFTPSPPEYEVISPPEYEGISPALRRGPLPFSAPGNVAGPSSCGMPPPGDEVIHEMITEGSMAAVSSPGFFTQEEARATAAITSRGASMAAADHQDGEYVDGSQPVNVEEEEADGEEEDVPDPATGKGKKKRKKDSPPTEPRIKWMCKEEECLAEAWRTVSMNGITGANQNYETYWQQVKIAFHERKIVDPYFNKTVMIRGDKAMGTHWGIIQTACSKWHGIQEEIESHPESGADFEQKIRRAFDMYRDDTGLTFKFVNVFACLEKCKKWAEVRRNLAKNKDEQYNPDAPAPAASTGHPELGQRKLKDLKKTGHHAERLQASFDKCWADARAHAAGRDDKYDVRWKEMLANQGARIALLKATSAAKKRNTDLAFLIGGTDGKMDEETKAWYNSHRANILRPPPSSVSSSTPASTSSSSPSTTSTPTAATTAAHDASPPDNADDKLEDGTADVPVIL